MTNLNRTIKLLACASLAVFFVTTTAFAQETISKKFDVKEGGTLELDIDYGTIHIEPSSGKTVTVDLIRRIKGVSGAEESEILDHHEYKIEQRGSDVYVESRFDRDSEGNGAWRKWKNDSRFSLEVNISVPEVYNVEFTTGAGNITIADLEGTIRGKTGAGNVILGDILGGIDISSGAGNIEVDGARGYVYANSGAGNVTVYLDSGVGATVDGQASIGSAKTDYDLDVKGKWMSKSFSGKVNGGGPSLTLHSGVGNVTLRKL